MTDLITRLREAKHRLAHFFGVNRGHVQSFWIGPELWVGFRCCGCNQIDHARKSLTVKDKANQ